MTFSCEMVGFRQVRVGSKNICLNCDWYKVSEIWCEPDKPDMTNIDRLVESYRNAKEIRKNLGSEKATFRNVAKKIKEALDKARGDKVFVGNSCFYIGAGLDVARNNDSVNKTEKCSILIWIN